MKKIVLGMIPLIIIIGIIGCAGGAKSVETSTENSELLTLDQAIHEAAIRIDERIARGSKIAPLNFNSPHDSFSSYVLEELTANLVESRVLTVVDRREIDLIRNEFDFQFSGEVGDDSMQRMGQMLGAQSIISGSFTAMGGFHRIMIRVLNVENATVEVQYRANIVSDTVTTALLTGGRTNVASTTSSQTTSSGSSSVAQSSSPQTTTPTPTIAIEVTARSSGTLFFQNERVASLWENETHTIPIENPGTYNIKMVFPSHEESRSIAITTRGITRISFGGVYTVGQPGPAGGIVFFDKGSYSDGWRYLEAASSDIAGTAEWGARGRQVGRTTTGRGAGKRNTQIIADFLSENGETGRAAQITQEFRQGGYDDWFLPSKDELNIMYVNLKERGLGRFQNGWYWSSSEENDVLAWRQNFDNGDQSTGNQYGGQSKRDTYNVRAIRQF